MVIVHMRVGSVGMHVGSVEHAAATPMIWVYHLPCQDGAVQDSTLLSQTSLRWRRALSPRKSSLQEDWVLRGLTLHQLKDIITDIYASKAKADSRQAQPFQLGLAYYASHTCSVQM